MKVVKFGGTSLASAENILRASAIVRADPARTFVVVSAPGRCADYPRKMTDLLIDAHTRLCHTDSFDAFESAFTRFHTISAELGVDITPEIDQTRRLVGQSKCDYDFIVSRGEYLMAVLFSRVLGYTLLDAMSLVVIKQSGRVDLPATRANFARLDPGGRYVMPGFFGRSAKCGTVRVFARGGSDYSGAIAAVCMNAELYENFTDTYGVQTANPAVVKNTHTITALDYATLHKLCRAGATVIFPDCVPLLKNHQMPLRIDNTFDAGRMNTLVTAKKETRPYFSITYETKRNINKDTIEILCVLNKITFPLERLRTVLGDAEVYLVEFSKSLFRLIAPAANLVSVITLLHSALTESKSIAPA